MSSIIVLSIAMLIVIMQSVVMAVVVAPLGLLTADYFLR
jgi:hypothetical protein